MTGIHSKHHNSYEDRLWDFQSSSMLTSTTPVLSDWVNNWDGEFTWGDDSKVFVGMYSVHDNHKEDRRFKFYQSAHGSSATGCYWTGETGWDAEWTLAANQGSAITGLWSRHDNHKEDRIFKLRFCQIVSTAAASAAPTQSAPVWTGFVNSYDQEVNWVGGNGYVMTGIHSKHHNSYEDRLWDFQSSSMLTSTTPVLSDWVNNWDGEFTWGDDSKVFVGMYSVHDNHKEDRRFKFYQSAHGSSATGCYWTGETGWDAEWTLAANQGSAITGLWSRHDNHKEDRIFKLRFCQIV